MTGLYMSIDKLMLTDLTEAKNKNKLILRHHISWSTNINKEINLKLEDIMKNKKSENKIVLNLTSEEQKKVGIFQSKLKLPSFQLAIRKIIELYSISSSTR